MSKNTQPRQVLRLLFWETTIKCNLNCAHCRRIEGDAAAVADLTRPQALGLIGQLAELGRGQSMMPVLVFSGGEPLCRDDIFELMASAREAGLTLALATNGTLIDAAAAQRIRDCGVARVSVSLDGATPEVHDRLRQLEGSFKQAIAGIRHLHAHGVPFQINITLTRHNCHQLGQLHGLAQSLGAVAVHIFMLVPVGCGQTLAETDMLSADEYERMLTEICKLDAQGRLQMKVTCGPHYERVVREQGLYGARKGASHPRGAAPGSAAHGPSRGCLAGSGVLFVAHQGDVFPCGYLPVNCGNVLRSELAEIWRHNRDLARMRDAGQLQGKCGVCGYREICGGCRGRAYAATGNYMAEEPFCAYIPPQATR